MALYCPTLVPVKGCEGPPPAIQSLPQVLELIKAHSAGQIPLRQQSQSRTLNTSPKLWFPFITHCVT